jgi:hypothetical protein
MTFSEEPNRNLRNLHQTLQLDNLGNPEMRVGARITNDDPIPVTLGSESITITGDVVVSSSVSINNSEADAVHTHITQVGSSGVLDTPYLPVGGEIAVTQTTTPWIVDGEIGVRFDPTNTDAFGRQRVSNPFTLFDSSFRYGDNPVKWSTALTGISSTSFLTNESSINLTVGTTSGDGVIRETKRVFSYQPGKSLLIMNTFVMNTPKSNLRQRVGYFGAQNGIYFECVTNSDAQTTLNLVIRKFTAGFVDDTSEKIPQASWNGDRLDGSAGSNNPSGKTLDVTKAQIFWMDVEWLGVGSVRCGFVIDGKFLICHTFHHANLVGGVYMTTATLPIRYEISNTAGTASTSTLKQICSTVISEGGYASTSRSRSVSNPLTGTALSQVNLTPIISMRLKSDRLDGVVFPARLELFGLQSNAYKWAVIVGGAISSGGDVTWIDAGTDSNVEYNLNATTITGGIVIDQGIFVGNTISGPISAKSVGATQEVQLGRNLDGTTEIFTVAAVATSNNNTAVCSLVWEEFG